MIPLLVLLGSFLVLLLLGKRIQGLTPDKAGRMAFSLMLLFTGTSHFYLTKGMVLSMPPFIPFKEFLVYATGVLEIGLAIAFVLAKNKRLVAWLLIAFLVAVFPSNVYAAMNHIDIQNATTDGPGPSYLFFRLPLQLLFIGWVYYFGIRKARAHLTGEVGLAMTG